LSGFLEKLVDKNGEGISGELMTSVVRQLFNNLIAMLNKEICHRDIKPANVLKIKDDFFLADFGESEALEGKELLIDTFGT
jgi:serine/threonine protein kinase